MRLHEQALRAAAEAVRRPRYLAHEVSDQQLAQRCIEAYYDAKPDRSRRGVGESPVPSHLRNRPRE